MKTTLRQFIFCGAFLATLSLAAQTVSFQSSSLPIVVIDTEGRTVVDEPKVMATMGIINNASGEINNLSDDFTDYNGFIGIEYRGSSSQAIFPKKSFGIETWDAEGNDIDTTFLGLPSEEDWVLYGPYSDKTLVRNKLTFDLFEQTGRYSSRTKFVELVFNGQYHGVYIFMEKIKRDDNRVDIANLKPEDNTGEELTGGYILKLDKFDGSGGGGFASEYRPPHYQNDNQQIFFQYHIPEDNEITASQKEYIQAFIKGFESTLQANTYRDPVSGYYKYVDLGSFVDFFLINELSRNVDGYRLSTFMYKDKDEKGGLLTLGPIWDFNLAFGNADYCQGGDTGGWAYKFNQVCPGDFWLIPFWWDKLLDDPAFRRQVKLRWLTLREGSWSDEAIDERINAYANQLAEAQQRNFQRWPVIGTYVWPNNYVGSSYADEISYLQSWTSQRLSWLDQEIGQFEGHVDVTGLADYSKSVVPYPNPFSTHAYFRVAEGAGVLSVKIFSFSGQLVRTIHSNPESPKELVWDGKDASGNDLPPATYLYQVLKNDQSISVGKLIKSVN